MAHVRETGRPSPGAPPDASSPSSPRAPSPGGSGPRGSRVPRAVAVGAAVVGLAMVVVGLEPLVRGLFTPPAAIREVSYIHRDEARVTASPESQAGTSPPVTATSEPSPSREEIIAVSAFQPVPLAPITRITIDGAEVSIDAAVAEMDAEVAVVGGVEVSVIDPPNTEDAFVWRARATQVGITWTADADDPGDFEVLLNDDRAPEIFGHAGLGVGVFGNLTRLAVGDSVTLTTSEGILTYEVRGIHETPKGVSGAVDPDNPLVAGTGSPMTLMLGSCIPDGPGGTSTTAAVYTAVLVSSHPQQ